MARGINKLDFITALREAITSGFINPDFYKVFTYFQSVNHVNNNKNVNLMNRRLCHITKKMCLT